MSQGPDDLMAFTHALAGVPPDPGRLDRDALLFAGGRAAGRRKPFWPATSLVLAALSGALAVALVTRPPAIVEVERIVYVTAPGPVDPPKPVPSPPPKDLPTPTETPGEPALGSETLAEGLRQWQRVLGDGPVALPQAPWAAGSSRSSPDVPDLSSLRLLASHPDGEPWR
jgi:hypothetical protein